MSVTNINEGPRFSQCLAPKLLRLPQFTVTSNYLICKYKVRERGKRECFSWAFRHKRKVLGQRKATVLSEGQNIFTGICLKTTETKEDHVLRLLKTDTAANSGLAVRCGG